MIIATTTSTGTATERAEPLPTRSPPLVAIAGARIARLVSNDLEVWSSDATKRELVFPLGSEPKAIGVLGDDSIIAMAMLQVCVLAPGAAAPACHPKVTAAEGRTYVWRDATNARRFWLAEGPYVLHAELPVGDGKVAGLDDYPFTQIP